MCYTKEASIGAFLTAVITSILLMIYGSQRYQKVNIFFGLMFIFVAFMQLIDYLIYIDPKCNLGSNQLAGYLGPLFNALQPTIVFVLFIFLIEPTTKSIYSNHKNFFIVLNLIYLGLVLFYYFDYIKNTNQCTKEKFGRPLWLWNETRFNSVFNNGFYLAMLSINLLLLIQSVPFTIIPVALIVLLFFVSKINYKYHLGEFWCFFANSLPLFILIVEKVFFP
jgi:hypothetical protein